MAVVEMQKISLAALKTKRKAILEKLGIWLRMKHAIKVLCDLRLIKKSKRHHA